MSLSSLLLSYTPLEKAGVSDAAPYLTGFLVVIVTLAVLMGVCMAVSKILQTFQPEPAAPKPMAKPAANLADDVVPPEIIAAIAAAVTTTVGKKQRIVSIRPQNSSWSQAGRHQIHSSHNVR